MLDRHSQRQTPLLMHLHQNQSETTGSLEETRGSGAAATTVEGHHGRQLEAVWGLWPNGARGHRDEQQQQQTES